MNMNEIRECGFDPKDNKTSWEKIYQNAKTGNWQWLHLDVNSNPDAQHLDVISCLGPGCSNNKCPLLQNIIAILIKNEITVTRCIGVIIRIRVPELDSRVCFRGGSKEKILSFLMPPNINTNYIFSGNRKHASQIAELIIPAKQKFVNLTVFVDVIRDIDQQLSLFTKYSNNSLSNDWTTIPAENISTFQLIAIRD